MLEPPASSHRLIGDELHVTVTFNSGPQAEGGRIFRIYDRHPGGSALFLWNKIADEDWMDMTFDAEAGAWKAAIPLDPAASSIEFFSNHGLVVEGWQTYLSSPYTRVALGPPPVGGIAGPAAMEIADVAAPGPWHSHPSPWCRSPSALLWE